jgi:7-cyano-7-deazaguanine synthase
LAPLGQLLDSALTNAAVEVPLGHYEQASMKSTFVPNRNAIFCSIAFGHALSIAQTANSTVQFGLGVHSGDHAIYPDCRPEFYQALMHAFEIGNWNSELVRLALPYLHSNKAGILHDARASIVALGLDFDTVFRNTCTSYAPDAQGRSSGLTGSDVERILAFHQLGWVDPIDYQMPWPQAVAGALELEREFRQVSAHSHHR